MPGLRVGVQLKGSNRSADLRMSPTRVKKGKQGRVGGRGGGGRGRWDPSVNGRDHNIFPFLPTLHPHSPRPHFVLNPVSGSRKQRIKHDTHTCTKKKHRTMELYKEMCRKKKIQKETQKNTKVRKEPELAYGSFLLCSRSAQRICNRGNPATSKALPHTTCRFPYAQNSFCISFPSNKHVKPPQAAPLQVRAAGNLPALRKKHRK